MGQPAAPPPPDPGPPLEPSPDIGGPPPTELPPGPPPPLPELEQLPRPEHHGPGIPYDPRIGRYESPYDRDAAAAVERVMRGARFGYDWIEFFDDFALGEYPEWQQRAVERQWIFEETGVDPGPLPPRDEYDFIQPLPPRVIRSDDSLVWPWEEGWLPPWDRPHGWTPWFLQAVDTSTRRPGTVFGPPSPFEPPVVIEQQQPRPTAAERRAGAAERDRIIREAAQQAARDAAIRSGAAVVIEGIARAVTRRGLPPGVRDVLFPDTLSPGTISTEEAITRGL
ncbi:MAG TPA: hypothetical protein VFI89_09835, partial [Burkholderiales bacterium]|nr:hypothetical protein [Burkholderiales bacterium]